MGSELGQGDPRSPARQVKSFEEQFNELCPYFLSMGMPYELYWDGDCEAVKYYFKADKLRQDKENEFAWLIGLYMYEVLCDVAPILHAFAKRGTVPHEYSKEPYIIDKQVAEEKQKEKDQQKLRELREKLIRLANNNGRGK